MTDIVHARSAPAGHVAAPEEVWAQAREDYLDGLSAPQVCRRHGLNLATLRSRAAREGWRRVDQPWIPPQREALDPLDEGADLEAEFGGDVNAIEPRLLAALAETRMARAVLRGQAAEALRWRRVRDAMQAEQADFDRFLACEREYEFQHGGAVGPSGPDSSDSFDSSDSDSVFDAAPDR